MPGMTVEPCDAPCGARVTGVDLATGDPATIAALRQLLCENGVLVLPGQDLTPDRQLAFTRGLGAPERHVLSDFALPDMPEVFVVSNVRRDGKPIGAINAGQYWHSDLAYTARPTFASLLYAVEVPKRGGETLYADMVRAWETLPEDLKRTVAGRRAVHDYALVYETVFRDNPDRRLTPEKRALVPPVVHPVVRTQPETGRKALFVSPGFTRRIEGLPEAESRAALDALIVHATRPDNIYVHHWRAGDLVMWDNRVVMHQALANYAPDARRYMLRTSVTGELPA
jgi:taurine dioxygenase